MHEVTRNIEGLASFLRSQAGESEQLGRMPDKTVAALRKAGAIRIMQPRKYAGFEAHPVDWVETVATAASQCGSTGWICGIVGVHPWHMALCHPKLQEEIWGENPDTWIASPYAPMGTAVEADDGYILNGRWSFSSGTDHCDWIFLGGRIVDASGANTCNPPQTRHFVLPRKDYEIVPDSWNVVGLKGTGSKDIIVRDTFVPKYRAINTYSVREEHDRGYELPTSALYRMPFSTIFGAAIAAGVIGMCEGLMAEIVDYQRTRVDRLGRNYSQDPALISHLGNSAADIHASKLQLKDDLSRMFDILENGDEVPYSLRAQARRNQVRGVQRAVDAADRLFTSSGGNAVRTDMPIQRLWRDAHVGLNHAINVPQPIYQAYAATTFGYELNMFVMV